MLLSLLLLAAPVAVQAQFGYAINAGGATITITNYTGTGGAVAIPTTISGLTVTGIGTGGSDYVFYGTGVTSVTISNGVTSLGDYAFYDCPGLTKVAIPASVTSIGYAEFAYDGLTNVTIPGLVAYMGEYAFYGCSNMARLTISNSASSIGTYAFDYCTSLASITVPGNLTNAGNDFFGCPNLTSVTISDGAASVVTDEFAWTDFITLTAVTIPSSVLSIGEEAFISCSNLTSLTMSNGVTSIGYGAFAYASLASLTIPSSVSSLADYAFYECPSLASVYFEGNAPTADTTVFEDDPVTAYYLPGTTGWAAFTADTGVTAIELAGSGLTVAFTAAPTSGEIPLAVSFTSTNVDSGGHAITRWYWSFGDGVTSGAQNPTHNYTTAGAYSLTLMATNNLGGAVTGSGPASISALPPPALDFTYTNINGSIVILSYTGPGGAVTIPSSIGGLPVVDINADAFYGTSVTSLMIPASVIYLENYAFMGCSGLTSVYFEGNAPGVDLGFSIFDQDYDVTVYYLPGTTGWGVFASSVPAPVVELAGVAITAAPTSGNAPLEVNFTSANVDSGDTAINNWNWSFGDGSTSALQNPSHNYTSGGVFSAALISFNALGAPLAGAVTSITVAPPLPAGTVGFTATPTSGYVPLTVSFNSASVDYAGNAITRWNWNFGDGSTSTNQDPSHSYISVGTFPIALTATNNLGATLAGYGPATITTAQEWDYTITPDIIAIVGYYGITYVTNTPILSITGCTASNQAVGVTIPSWLDGLAVSGLGAYSFNYTSLTSVTVPASVTNLGEGVFQHSLSLASVIFEGNAPTADDTVFTFTPATIYYFAGTTGWAAFANSTGLTPVELTAIAITANPTNGAEPLPVSFTSPAVDGAGHAISNRSWTFGDGYSANTQNPTHTYSIFGTYSAALIETNASGLPVAGASVSITGTSPTIAYTANPIAGYAPMMVAFNSPDVDIQGNAITSWNWNFGDGSTSASQNPTHLYINNGVFPLALIATNDLGYTVFGSGTPSVQVLAVPQFIYTTNNGTITITSCSGEGGTLFIPNLINGLPVTSIASFAFASHTSLVNLVIPASVNSIGTSAFQYCTALNTVIFEGNPPALGSGVFAGVYPHPTDPATAEYLSSATGWGSTFGGVPTKEMDAITTTANPTNGFVPLTVGFTAPTVDGASNAITSWIWIFGDGSISGAQNPSHTYTNSGAFSVTLLGFNSNVFAIAGTVGSITAFPLTMAATANPTAGNVPLMVNFTSANVDNAGHAITNWDWTFGDGSASVLQNPSHLYTNAGTYSPALMAANNLGDTVTAAVPSITVLPLTLAFNATPTSGNVPLNVSFTSPNVDSGANAISRWNWSFGDGATSALQNPSHLYTSAGVYSPVLIATNSLGDTVFGSGPAAISVLLPVPPTTNFTVLFAFAGTDGAYPYAGPILSGNTLYGTTEYSLSPIDGTVFSLNDATLRFMDLFVFPDLVLPNNFENYNGANPKARVILSGDTLPLYGTTSDGGQAGYGNVFSVLTDELSLSNSTALHYFSTPVLDPSTGLETNSDGIGPQAALVLAGNTLYGTAEFGGSNGYGTVFSFNTENSNFTTVYNFAGGADGAYPLGDLIVAGNTLYGTANKGGSNGFGAVFSINTNGSNFARLYSFTSGNDGAYPPQGALLLSGGTLYGAADKGGSNGFGTVFSVNTNGSNFAGLYSFTNGADGASPAAGLLISNNTLYGVAAGGGAGSNGTIFSLTLGSHGADFTTLYSFTPTNGAGVNSDGAMPQPGLVLSGNLLYGEARYGGGNGYGTVFSLPLKASIQPAIAGVSLSGANLVLNVNNGQPGATYYVLASPNLARPLSQWTPVATNGPIASGNFTITVTNTVTRAVPQKFYILETP
jgi:uncharacterized repeat protein (TIGR03803 family)